MSDKRRHVWGRTKGGSSFSDTSTAVDDGPTSISDGGPLAATLEIVDGPAKGRLHIFDNNGGTIGRGEDCDLMLADDTLSRRHAEITFDGESFVLRDLDSTNGTRVAGRPVDAPVPLEGRCRIVLGKHTAIDFTGVDLAGLDLAYRRMEGEARLTIQQEYSRRITRQARQLRNTVDDLELFTRSAAHDLRSPLQAILLTAQALKDVPTGHDETAALAQEIMDTSSRVENLLRELIDYTRMRQEPVQADFVALDDVLDDVMTRLGPAIRESGAEVHRTDLPEIVGHRDLLVILLQNLVENAIKYRSQARPVVRIRAAFNGKNWVVTVKDNGVGLPLGDVNKLFEPFERAHTGEHVGGFGLGLALVKRAVELHGGEVWADTGQTAGAAFHFTLPASMDRWREARPTSDPDEGA